MFPLSKDTLNPPAALSFPSLVAPTSTLLSQQVYVSSFTESFHYCPLPPSYSPAPLPPLTLLLSLLFLFFFFPYSSILSHPLLLFPYSFLFHPLLLFFLFPYSFLYFLLLLRPFPLPSFFHQIPPLPLPSPKSSSRIPRPSFPARSTNWVLLSDKHRIYSLLHG